MKTHVTNFRMKFLSILMGTGMLSLTAFAGGNVQFRPAEDQSTTAFVILDSEQGNIRLSIENDDNTVVYFTDRQSNLQKYKKRFDFSSLEDGKYNLIASIDGEEFVKQFEIVESKLDIVEETMPDVTTPFLKRNGDKLVLLYENKANSGALINFSSNDEIFFSDNFEGGEPLRRKYNLGQLPAGSYEVEIFVDSKLYSYPVIVE